VNAQEFIEQVGRSDPAQVHLFCPAKPPRARLATFEPLLADRAVQRVIDTYVDPSMKDLCYTTFHAEEAKPGEIVLEAQTLPFLAERRVILVRNAERYQSEAAAGPLIAYIQSPNDTTVLLLITAQLDKRTKLYKACDKSGVIVECPELSERELEEWARGLVAQQGKTIDRPAVRELVGRAGSRLSDVENAVTLVTGYVGEAERVSEEDVRAACADVAEEEVWALTDAIAASRTGPALVALRKLMDLGKREDDLMGIINWLLKNAYAVASAGAGSSGLSPFVARKMAPLADKLGVNKLRDAFALCTDTHFMMRTTGVDSALALELLVIKLAAPRRRRP